MLIKIIGESVKFIGSKYIQESLINMSLQRYISYLNKHIVTLHNVSLRLLRSVNTLNSKLKFKTILINKSQLLLKALYLEATLTFLRFAAKHCSIAQLFGDSYQLYGAMLHIPNSAEGNCLTEKENHTLCLKSDIKTKKFANYQNVIVRNSPALGRHVFVSS